MIKLVLGIVVTPQSQSQTAMIKLVLGIVFDTPD
jgi:hypothetical protein